MECPDCGKDMDISSDRHSWICKRCGRIVPRMKEKKEASLNLNKFNSIPTHTVVKRIFLKPFGHVGDIIEDNKTRRRIYFTKRNRKEHFFRKHTGWGIQAVLFRELLGYRTEGVAVEIRDEDRQIKTSIDNFILKHTEYGDPRIADQKLAKNYVVRESLFKNIKNEDRIIVVGY